jgi:uncharacterized protein (TIGR01777 family)
MKVFIVGGSGFIGRSLIDGLKAQGYWLTVLVRPGKELRRLPSSIDFVTGDPMEPGAWQDVMTEHDVIINLAGATIFRRWSDSVRAEILDSRIITTRRIVEALKNAKGKSMRLFNASGIGYYGHCGDEILDEYAPPGNTFLARVALEWESEARKAEELNVGVVLCRFGIVLGKNGGALRRIAALTRFYLGGAWGSGKQWFSWIHIEDVVKAFLLLLEHRDLEGAVNFTAPQAVRNREMVTTFREVLKKSTLINTIPEALFKLVLGEFSGEFLKGQRVSPCRLLENGFAFQCPTLKEALTDLLVS